VSLTDAHDRGVEAGVKPPREAYGAALEQRESELSELRVLTRRVEAGRMVAFLVGSIVGLLYRDLPVPAAVAATTSGVALFVFIVLIIRHRVLRRQTRAAEAAEALARVGLLRLERKWPEMAEALSAVGYDDPLLRTDAASEAHPYESDLDLFGPASIRALLGPTPTPVGMEKLREWLSSPAPMDEVLGRQTAVRSLAPDFEGREALAIEGLQVDRMAEGTWRGFRDWLSSSPLFAPREERGEDRAETLPVWSIYVARVLPPITLGLFVFYAARSDVPALIWIVPLFFQALLAWRWGQMLDVYLGRASAQAPGLRRYDALFAGWEDYSSTDPVVRKLQEQLTGGAGRRASEEVRRLGRWLDAADSRASSLHGLLAACFLWDVHVAWGMERWRIGAGNHAEAWFDAVGELEALAALATLAHDHPDWCWPELRDGAPHFEADGLGHPLLADNVVQRSDVRLDPPGRFLLVTGSNMSGKSTLLRSIGLAAVLAQAGSVVCARRAVVGPLRTFTSMRIHDSLTGGVSLFMAELLRLKALVDASTNVGSEPGLLYLVDEVLQGTNSEERRVAARRIIAHLLNENAIGAVTTHDLALHEDPVLDPASSKVHFREQVGEEGDQVLTFDYVLRPGLATSRNALKLLRIVGLDVT
jgi:hypothetical protein